MPVTGAHRYRAAVKAVAVMSLSTGMVATVALPSYAVEPDGLNTGRQAVGWQPKDDDRPAAEPQRIVVAADAEPVVAARDEIGATTEEELEAQREQERREREEAERRQRAAAEPVVGEAPALPSEVPVPPGVPAASPPSEHGGSIVSVARQYLGVPYVFGGASPAGFDCSGLVKFVYAQFGISMPHSSLQQGANGTRVSHPVPGDLVVLDGGNHIGIYTGNGNMIDAPMPGRVVNERPIYTANHFFVRY
jgi:cell wall-associated NlpC family hydrolase